ncbi:MAG TPA: hypothetical protein VIK11_01910, partial [Tepidiformaceae bacterium]
ESDGMEPRTGAAGEDDALHDDASRSDGALGRSGAVEEPPDYLTTGLGPKRLGRKAVADVQDGSESLMRSPGSA